MVMVCVGTSSVSLGCVNDNELKGRKRRGKKWRVVSVVVKILCLKEFNINLVVVTPQHLFTFLSFPYPLYCFVLYTANRLFLATHTHLHI